MKEYRAVPINNNPHAFARGLSYALRLLKYLLQLVFEEGHT